MRNCIYMRCFMRIYPYLRASTKEQDAQRGEQFILDCAAAQGWPLPSKGAWFYENISGATLDRPELKRAVAFAQKGDVILVESVDRLGRLNYDDWKTLMAQINERGIQLAIADVPSSLNLVNVNRDDVSNRILAAVNEMMLDIFAAQARYDYESRRRRQAEGIKKAKAAGVYKNRKRHDDAAIKKKYAMAKNLLKEGFRVSHVKKVIGRISYQTIYELKAELDNE